MLNWLKSLFVWHNGPVQLEDVYKPKERLIYRYWNGKEEVAVDPMVLYKRLMDKGPEISIDLKVASSASKDNRKAHDRMIGTLREVFSLESLVNGGLTEQETQDLMDHFLLYVESIKKNSNPTPISVTETSPLTDPSSGASPPTENISDSGPTVGASNTGERVPS
jgi:hypothetical protein